MTTTDTQADQTLSTKRSEIANTVVLCRGLTKVFKDFWMRDRVRAVDNIDLDVRKGEVFGLLGPNGSGKSTTIKMILGLLHPTAGQISVMGKRPDNVDAKKAIGYLPEESYLYRFLNARETLDYYGRLFHQSAAQRTRRIDMLLEMVGLDAVWRRPVGEYSKGMQRRIGLAQALINDPHLLILDEPTTGLDPLGTRQIKDLILKLKARGKTIILCSHLLADVEDVCDRACIMFGGKVRAFGTCEELLTDTDQTTFATDRLDDNAIQEIENVLAKHGRALNKVDHPRQRLEQLFLDIVHRAQEEGQATSGARASARIAEFLQHGTDEEDVTQGALVIDDLVSGATAEADKDSQKASIPEKRAADIPEAKQPREFEDDGVLNNLMQKEEPQPTQPSQPQQSQINDEDEAEKPDTSVIDSLIEKPKDN